MSNAIENLVFAAQNFREHMGRLNTAWEKWEASPEFDERDHEQMCKGYPEGWHSFDEDYLEVLDWLNEEKLRALESGEFRKNRISHLKDDQVLYVVQEQDIVDQYHQMGNLPHEPLEDPQFWRDVQKCLESGYGECFTTVATVAIEEGVRSWQERGRERILHQAETATARIRERQAREGPLTCPGCRVILRAGVVHWEGCGFTLMPLNELIERAKEEQTRPRSGMMVSAEEGHLQPPDIDEHGNCRDCGADVYKGERHMAACEDQRNPDVPGPQKEAEAAANHDKPEVLHTDEAFREVAREMYHEDGRIEIDEGARISRADNWKEEGGVYVQAWVWVPTDEEGEDG